MINCVTGRWPLLSYGNYGCFCGLGGEGNPVDKIDRCCKAHDRCYSLLVANETCGRLQTYITVYSYETSDCHTDKATVSCGTDDDDCASAMCECDRNAVTCFMEHDDLYNVQFIFYDTWWWPRC
ncbi:Acidic phospholipase A2 KBf-grIB [Holothuria leucospilota]|uniref:Phospholipase A2 n=1 Tax=Holothuria leucospilota TaxID=206669 RepID=A0A9Q1C709_HOLLE|nr:Acidic phospholipase A2 KBf-grIB [Holothuria leucospilota]